MKQLMGCLVVVIALAHNLWAQASCMEQPVLVSLLPIQWSMHWDCNPSRGSASGIWSGSIDTNWLKAGSCQVTTSGSSISFSFTFAPRSFGITVDTAIREITALSIIESNNYSAFNAKVEINKRVPYQETLARNSALITDDYSFTWSSAPDCQDLYGGPGWIGLGGAAPPSTVSGQHVESVQRITALTFSNSTQFSFAASKESPFICIFDLLGREVARIDVPAGAESVEYNTSRLSPGIYFAVLGRDVVKFAVN